MSTGSRHIYESTFVDLLHDVRVSEFMKPATSIPALEETDVGTPPLDDLLAASDLLVVSDTLYCSYCAVGFVDRASQRGHYKLDWHRYNLKQALAGRRTVAEDKFGQILDGDLSSISGSEDEAEIDGADVDATRRDERLKHLIARRSRVLFANSSGQVISVHRCLLLGKKEEAACEERLVGLVKQLPHRTVWLVVMLGGGHFAAAIFKEAVAVLHKTVHSYTVRKGQGGTQSSKDNKGTHSKSAGASLRRFNEQSLVQHVQETMKSWGADIVKCDLVFYRAVGRANAAALFAGVGAPLLKTDPRLRTIPFPTRRPTFSEVKRVHDLLTTAFVYDSEEMFKTNFAPPVVDSTDDKWAKKCIEPTPVVVGSPKKSQIDRGKERPSPVRELPVIVQQLAAISTSGSESGDLVLLEEEISFLSLREYEDTVPRERVEGKKKKKKNKAESTCEKVDSMSVELRSFWEAVHGAVARRDVDGLTSALTTSGAPADDVVRVLNQRNVRGETIVHQMAADGQPSVIRLLLETGGDPTIKDRKGRTPYDHASDRLTRESFRRFMGKFPDRHDYSKSHIPSPLTDEIASEAAEKRRAARKAKRAKGKERRDELDEVRREENEKSRFLALSDREKRAVAAERRLLASAPGPVVLSRCYDCADDLTGRVPFEYDENRFCTMQCLKRHRLAGKSTA